MNLSMCAAILENEKTFSRRSWVESNTFHPLSDADTLLKTIEKTTQHPNPVVILDLDSTLYEVKPRTHKILKEWGRSAEALDFPELHNLFSNLQYHEVGYSIRDTFDHLNLCQKLNSRAIESVKTFWRERFFTSDYLPHDHAYPGTSDFAWRLYESGAHLVYLTGRDHPGMGTGTLENLRRDGFPIDLPRTLSMLKPHREMDDLLHKKAAAEKLKDLGTVVASFENEPLNVVALSKIFPEAMHVFVDTVCSDQPAPLGEGLYKISSFL